MTYAQTNRRIAVKTPLGPDVLLLRGFTGSESISHLFEFDLDLLSENASLTFDDLVGKKASVRIYDASGAERTWFGSISRFSQGPRDRRLTSYRAQMVPWLWFLTRTADCRIFQNQNVPDIIQKVFKDLGFHDYELRLYGSFPARDYCVQYRETDFNFVSRLMEEEGICYFFQHKDDKETMILANDPAAHEACPGQPTAQYDFRGGNVVYEDVITEWRYEQEFRPGAWTHTDYNFETPSTDLAVTLKDNNPYEIYDYPGEHRIRSEGERLARIRLQEQIAARVVSQGSSGCRHFNSGFTFTLEDHYRPDLNQAYLLTAVEHVATQGGGYQSGTVADEDLSYRNTFQCIPTSVPFRAPRITPAARVQGCQTAVVVGPPGKEIYTDPHGRIKVQFHWDREGKKNENSSCWIRVSHPSAGKGWGSVQIPRIGQEVIVDFLEGDPDQPIIVGRVYNGEQTPPNGLPGSGMVAGFKSNSTPGGGGSNEMSMDDTKGKEKVTIHGQYDMSTTVEHDDTQTVHNNRTITVDGTHTEKIKNATAITITNGDYHHDVAANTANYHVKGAISEVYEANQSTTVTNQLEVTSKTAHIHVTACTDITLKVGASSLLLRSDGYIQLKGVSIVIDGSSSVNTHGGAIRSTADNEHEIKGSLVSSDGSTTNTVSGGMVMLNP